MVAGERMGVTLYTSATMLKPVNMLTLLDILCSIVVRLLYITELTTLPISCLLSVY